MAIHYRCRYCSTKVGTIDYQNVTSQQLGFHHLDEQERQEMIRYGDDGDIHVNTICEDCQEAFQRNPDYHQIGQIIQ